jgi:translation initiation factor 2B subunit (eIF-2B alpha/beta/delta family)
VADLSPELERRIALVASDRESGASEILVDVIAILQEAVRTAQPITYISRALCRAQPTMASVWNAALQACAPGDEAALRLDRFAERVSRAPAALARFAQESFAARNHERGSGNQDLPLRLVTLSFSGSVVTVLDGLRSVRTLRVSCSESRPALEGRRLASRLAGIGIPVTCFGDAALGHALAAADAVIVGADAVGPEWFLNKSGTRMLAAAAGQQGVPVYVVAARDKFVSHAVGARLVGREGAPAEIWKTPPSGVAVRNPYFEPTPLDLVTAVISDVGILGAAMVPDVCQSTEDECTRQALEEL